MVEKKIKNGINIVVTYLSPYVFINAASIAADTDLRAMQNKIPKIGPLNFIVQNFQFLKVRTNFSKSKFDGILRLI